ncbi:YheC/YheD family protein [Pontibacillus salicampi]|uniref:YheC/YheD family protein n=1 Tax=Pontibacillus salicampi TaxID=1449801 RepID=A0ABV6LM76_9BACI
MKSFHFHLQSYRSHKKRLIVPKSVYPYLKQVQTILYGNRSCPVEIMTHQKDEDHLFFSKKIMEDLHLYEQETVSCYVEGEALLVQPLLGVFTAGFESETDTPLGDRTQVFEAMAVTGQSYGFDTIFFGHQHINTEEDTVTGLTFRDGSWLFQTSPIPYVIYNRVPNRKTENHPAIKHVKQVLQSSTIWFNDGFFNKWKTYDQLIQSGKVAHLLPPTTLHPSKEKLTSLLQQHGSIYIKPIHGSKGTGILKCTLVEEDVVECMYYVQEKKIHQRYYDMNHLMEQQFPSGTQGYIAQPSIPLHTLRSSPMDYRVHTNKNERNEWEVTAVCTKFAGKGSVTTHVKRGGSLHTLTELFDDKESQVIFTKLERAALLVSKALEEKTSGTLGEIGFDFGIDNEGKVWLFEANSKPGFAIYDHPSFHEEQSVILSYPYRFARHLYLERLQAKQPLSLH